MNSPSDLRAAPSRRVGRVFNSRMIRVLVSLVGIVFMAACQSPSPVPTPVSSPANTPAAVIPTDLTHALELSSSTKTPSDSGFETVVAFYGLLRKELNLDTTPLTDALLRDETGNYYQLVHIDAANLAALDRTQLQVLTTAINQGGVTLLITAFHSARSVQVQALTAGEITGATSVANSQENYSIATAQPQVTQELTGLTITYPITQADYALAISPVAPHVQTLVQSTDDRHYSYSIFARYQNGKGSVFVVSDHADDYLKTNLLRENFYATASGTTDFEQRWFSQITPLMMVVKFAAGDKAWHNNHNYGNLTLDDPSLRSAGFNYGAILAEAKAHNFHFTLAMPPKYYTSTESSIVDLFRQNADYLSVVQHGNNHDGYEFYKYTTTASDPYPARPYTEQVADINEGSVRMDTFTQTYGIPYARAMVFPYNISPTQTLIYLKQQNYQATLNSSNVPLGETLSRTPFSYMYPAEMDYGNFAVILRYGAEYAPYPFDFFIGKPVFQYVHVDYFQKFGIGRFDAMADAMNAMPGKVEWRSIDYILKHLYLQKTNDDGSIDVMFFGNNIIVVNESTTSGVFHIRRKETLNVPIARVTLDGALVTYAMSDGNLQVDATIPAGASTQLTITYGP
jgi:hypothetical protein